MGLLYTPSDRLPQQHHHHPSHGSASPKPVPMLDDDSQRSSHVHIHSLSSAPVWREPRPSVVCLTHTHSYVAHATSRPSRVPRGSITRAMASGRRFVAGEAFFNYEAFGSLRPELQPVKLFSSAFLGLAVNALAAGFVTTLLKYAYRQMLGEYMRLQHDSYASSISLLLEWPASLSVFLGFLSDCRPIDGKRRKSYMIIGWLVACVGFSVVTIIDLTLAKSWELLDYTAPKHDQAQLMEIHDRVATYGHAMLALTLVAALGVQLMYIASLSMTVEFAQREPLRERGKLQAMFFVLYYIAAAVAQGIATLFVLADDDGHVRTKLSLGVISSVLAFACLLPLPFLVVFLDEPPLAGSTVHFSVRRRVHELWRFCHQNVVIRILAFLVVHFFLIGLYDKNARSAVSTWCEISAGKEPIVDATDMGGLCISLIFWMLFMANWPWRKIAGIGSGVYICGYIGFTALVVYDVARNDWFYIVTLAVLDMPRAWIQLYAVVLSTEIADNGREGVTLGLVFAFQRMVGVCAHMLSTGLGNWLPFQVSAEDVRNDSLHTRHQVMSGSMVVFAINFVSVLVVLVLPQQKLDAQQMRAFGGYNRFASYGIALAFSLLFAATFAMNTISLTK